MENGYLKEHIQKKLRSDGVIADNEVAQKSGDLFVAVNVITQERRVINFDNSLLEDAVPSNSRVLKG